MKRAVVADDTGLVKDLSFSSADIQFVSNQTGSGLEVVSLSLVNQEAREIVMSRLDGSLELVKFNDTTRSWETVTSLDIDEPSVQIDAQGSSLYLLTESRVYLVMREKDSLKIVKEHSLPGGPYSVVRFFTPHEKEDHPTRVIAATEAACPVVIDINSGKITWTGKNAPDTSLGLISVFRTECVCPISETSFVSSDNTGKLRFYKTEGQRKPVIEFPVFHAFNVSNNYTGTSGMGQTRPIKHLELTTDGKTLVMGDTYGSLIALDISKLLGTEARKINITEDIKIGTKKHMEFCRKLLPMRFSLPGVMGSVRSIAVTESNIYVVSAGRYAYAFDIKSKGKKFEKTFMKQKLTCCLPIEFLDKPVESGIVANDHHIDEDEGFADDQALAEILEAVESKADEDKAFVSKSKRRRLRKGGKQ
jgi:hypothetical protein